MAQKRVVFAKTTRPTSTGVLVRERLFARVDEARNGGALWVTGPPGCGKTTLAASYVEHRSVPSLWYQFDESDADVASFFYHLGLAVAQPRKRTAPRLPQLSPQHGIAPFARRYFQALYRHLGVAFTMVFDGFQAISPQSPLQEVMQLALAEIPPGGLVIIISRSEPPPSMARLRANGTLAVVGWRELRLLPEEARAIAERRGRALDEAELAELCDKTQGWAAAVILMLEQAALAPASPAAAGDRFAPQLVFDYLAGEIFEKTEARTRELLLATAWLPQMTAEMAEALSSRSDAGKRLADMHRSNYFVTLRQAQPQAVYEYHPLMREFLLARAAASLPKERRLALQRAAADLLEREGLLPEAMSLVRSIADWERAAGIIGRHGRAMLDSGRSETLAQWAEALPKEYREQHPWTLYWLGAALTYSSPRESRRAHERAHDLFSRQAQPDLQGLLLTCSGAMDAILHEVDDFSLLDRWIEVMNGLLRAHPGLVSGSLEARIVCSLFTSMVLRQPHHSHIEYWAERAYRTSLVQTDVNVRVSVEPRVALGIAYGGHFPKAWSIIEGVRQLAGEHDVAASALIMLKLVEATFFMLTAQRDACYAAVREGLAMERSEGVNVLSRQLLAYGAGGALAADDLDAAEAFLFEAKALPGMPARFDMCLHHLFSAWLAMRRHDALRAYQQHKLALQMAVEVGCPVFEILCRIVSAHVHYEGREPRAAWLQLKQVYDTARHIPNHLLEYAALLAYAYIALDSGRRPRSGMRALRRALAIGRPRNYLSFPLWRPEMLARLCSVALEAGMEPDFVARLIAERRLGVDSATSALVAWPWPLRVYTLGTFRVVRNGETIAFAGKAQRRPLDLLKVVIACGGRDVPEERVIEALWPLVDGDSAHRSFTTALHRLRRLIHTEGAVVLSDGKLTLDGRTVWVDTWAFDQIVAGVSPLWHPSAAGAGDYPDLAAVAARLVDCYRGPFLANEPERGWIVALQGRLRQRYARTVADVASEWRRTGDARRAVDFVEHAIEVDPACEGLYRTAMECYVALGRHAEALDAYGRCRTTLAATLGVDPSPATTALYQRLMQAA